MKEYPIIFSSDMIKAILDGIKSQTRRVIKPQPRKWLTDDPDNPSWSWGGGTRKSDLLGTDIDGLKAWCPLFCPYGQVGDRLYLKESHNLTTWFLEGEWWIKAEYRFEYENDGGLRWLKWSDIPEKQRQRLSKIRTWGKWRPARFMYKFLARVWLEITEVRAERLQEISWKDAKAEGAFPTVDIPNMCIETFKQAFEALWNSLNARRGYGWNANPWVWVISFRLVNNDN